MPAPSPGAKQRGLFLVFTPALDMAMDKKNTCPECKTSLKRHKS